jgi:integrase
VRLQNRLTAANVEAQKRPGRYADGGNLWLQVTLSGTKSWIYRYTRDAKPHHMGLGPYPAVSLQKARLKARAVAEQLADNVDPLKARDARRDAERASAAKRVTFTQAYERYIAQNEAGWRNEKHRAQWRATLATYADPIVGNLDVAAIETAHIVTILEPIWTTKTETASRLRGRIENVLAWAAFAGLRTGENPARWKGHLEAALPKPSKVKDAGHHAAMPYTDIAPFMLKLADNASVSSAALRFTILCAARTNEAIGATWGEFDLDAKLWVIPKARMKADKEHRVPLSDAAVELLRSLPREGEFVFMGAKAGKPLSNMAMLQLLRGVLPDQQLTVHGFRSSFRDWAGETTSYPREVIEHALAHQLKDKAEAAYQRGDLLNKRRKLMDDWAAHCSRFIVQDNVGVLNVRK